MGGCQDKRASIVDVALSEAPMAKLASPMTMQAFVRLRRCHTIKGSLVDLCT